MFLTLFYVAPEPVALSKHDMTKLTQTPSQTVGPFFAYGLTPAQYGFELPSLFTPVLAQPHAAGQHIRLIGQVRDGAGNTMHDAIVEISHADSQSKLPRTQKDVDSSGFAGFGRCGTGTHAQDHFVFDTIKPGIMAPEQAPFISVCILARGLLLHTFTRIYFGDEVEANLNDSVLQSLPINRRSTLIARREPTPHGAVYRFDIHMQGEQETVFFDL